MPLTFDDDECYRLMLAATAYVDEYAPATAGEQGNLERMEAVLRRLYLHYNAQRVAIGNPPVWRRRVENCNICAGLGYYADSTGKHPCTCTAS